MTRFISTWFYIQGPEEGGRFAQIREDATSEVFRDIYRRCIGVFFASARRANPESSLVLYLNRPWAESDTVITREVGAMLTELGVEMRVIAYNHEPPNSFTKSWRNQFFVIDVLRDMHQYLSSSDLAVVLDSDIVWTSRASACNFWTRLSEDGLGSYEVGYPPSQPVNGMCVNDLQSLMTQLQLDSRGRVGYSGGEIVAGTGREVLNLSNEASRIWTKMMRLHEEDTSLKFEEAHVLSMAYSVLDHDPGTANDFIRRLWTQPLKPRNVRTEDLGLALWHVPAEKKYGLARMYRRLQRQGLDKFIKDRDQAFKRRAARLLGIPHNSPSKFFLDIIQASLARLRRN